MKGKGPPGWGPFIVSIVAVLVAVVATVATWTGVISALNRNTAEEKAKREFEFASTIVYAIIEDASRKNPRGVSSSEIEEKFLPRAQAAEGIDFEKRKLQPLEVKKVILGLLALKVIYQTAEDCYVTVRTTFISGGEIDPNVARGATYGQLLIDRQPGEFTTAAMKQKIIENIRIGDADANYAVNILLRDGFAILDKDGKLWSQIHPPPLEKQQKQ
jgi:hypothetical protein